MHLTYVPAGYVSTFTNESVLESFDKLSLTADVGDREETARQIVLKRCGQTAPILFDDCYSQRILKKCRKIGEGVYGEVFMYKSSDNKCHVMKIIPIEGDQVVNGEHQKKFEEIISEIIIASELSNLRTNPEFCTDGFNELLSVCCIQGKYPQHLLDLWNLYDEDGGSENDSPEIFTDDQLYIVLDLANGGQDLEAYRFNNAEQAYSLFVQVVCSLAVAESALQFEHRDMHWGNILISSTDEPTNTFRLNGREFEVATKGVKVSIIDFTLSRMTYNNCCIFNDLSLDPDLFTATGDYQFEIYRLMRKRNLDDWQRFEPYSNILWLDYTLDKMIHHLRYLRVNTKTHKTFIRRLTQLKKKVLTYNSATEFLNSDVLSHVFL